MNLKINKKAFIKAAVLCFAYLLGFMVILEWVPSCQKVKDSPAAKPEAVRIQVKENLAAKNKEQVDYRKKFEDLQLKYAADIEAKDEAYKKLAAKVNKKEAALPKTPEAKPYLEVIEGKNELIANRESALDDCKLSLQAGDSISGSLRQTVADQEEALYILDKTLRDSNLQLDKLYQATLKPKKKFSLSVYGGYGFNFIGPLAIKSGPNISIGIGRDIIRF